SAVEMIENHAVAPSPGGLRAARKARREAGNRVGQAMSRVSREHPRNEVAVRHAWARNLAASTVWEAAKNRPTAAAYAHRSAAQAVGALELSERLSDPAARPLARPSWDHTSAAELTVQAILLRDVIGNPFRAVAVVPVWLAWNDGAVRAITQGIIQERAFD